MPLEQFLSNTTLLIALITAASIIELIIPLSRAGQDRTGRYFANLSLTVLTFLLNWGLGIVAVLAAQQLAIRPAAPLNALGLPPLADLLITIVALDFATWLAHLSMHKIPLMWRVHKVHHSDPFVDATTSFRQHPLEGLWRYLWLIAPTWVFGFPPAAFALYRLISAANAVIEHANITIGAPFDRLLSWVWVTPDMHKVHHSRKRAETDSNYSNILSIWDRLFGTFTPKARAGEVTYGLDDVDDRRSRRFSGLLALPMARQTKPASKPQRAGV